jgi:hypothetical protein
VVAVLAQVAVRQLPRAVDVDGERVRPRAARVEHRRHDPHRLVPGRPPGVVGGGHRQDVAALDADPPIGRRGLHRDVPRDRARGLEVVGVGPEQAHAPAVALQVHVGPQAAGMQVAGGPDEHAVLRHDVAVARIRPRPPLAGLARVRVAAVLAAGAAVDVEDRVDLHAHHVQPQRPELLHRGRPRRAVRDEVEVVGDVHVGGVRREVVDHVVHHPAVARAVAPAVAGRRRVGGLLLPGRERRRPVDEPHAVVQVDDVHARHPAAHVLQVGPEAGDPAVHRRPLVVELERDVVAPGGDVDRAEPVVQRLGLRRRREYEEREQAGEDDATHRTPKPTHCRAEFCASTATGV